MAAGKVLVVDDNKFNRMLVTAILKPLECEVFEAADGLQALAVCEREHPDLVLLDVVMPEKDGFSVLEAIRADPDMAECRVVMLTTSGSPADITHGAERGADAYVVKPFDHAELREKVAELLEG